MKPVALPLEFYLTRFKVEPRYQSGKVIVVNAIPSCSVCRENPGRLDTLTRIGWANLCYTCWVEQGKFSSLGVGMGQLWIVKAEAQSGKEALEQALEEFKRATAELCATWGAYAGDAIGNYPTCLPSFDEFDAQVQRMEVLK